MNSARRLSSRLLVSLGIMAASLFIASWWISRTFLDPDRFRIAIESTLASPRFTAPLAASLEQQLARQLPAGTADSRQLAVAVDTTLRDPAFQAAAADVAAAYLAAATTDRPRRQPELSLQQFRPSLVRALSSVAPAAANALPDDLGAARLPPIDDVPSVADQASWVRRAPPYLLALSVLLCATAMFVTSDRPRTLRRIGIGLLFVSAFPLVLRMFGPRLIALLVPSTDPAVGAVVADAAGDLMVDWVRAALWIAAAGILVTGFAVLWSRRTNTMST